MLRTSSWERGVLDKHKTRAHLRSLVPRIKPAPGPARHRLREHSPQEVSGGLARATLAGKHCDCKQQASHVRQACWPDAMGSAECFSSRWAPCATWRGAVWGPPCVYSTQQSPWERPARLMSTVMIARCGHIASQASLDLARPPYNFCGQPLRGRCLTSPGALSLQNESLLGWGRSCPIYR